MKKRCSVFSPWRIVDDCGGAFSMGLLGGSVFHGISGFRNAPSVSIRLRGSCNFQPLCFNETSVTNSGYDYCDLIHMFPLGHSHMYVKHVEIQKNLA